MKSFAPGFTALPALLFLATPVVAQQSDRHPVSLEEQFAIKDVDDPQVSPDGQWVAYTVSESVLDDDENVSDIWMASWDGSTRIRLTSTPKESESTPRWSPDGKSLAFLSSRGNDDDADQLWVLNRAGGEAQQVTEIKEGIDDYAWSPDGKGFVFVIEDGDSVEVGGDDTTHKDTKKPIVIDRYYFKEDYVGYLGRKRKHLFRFDLAARKLEQLTSGDFSEELPSWSPDGSRIAFTSKRGDDPDRNDNWDVYVMDAKPGAEAHRLTTWEGSDADPSWEAAPAWSPDGKTIAYLTGGPQKLIYYSVHKLAVIPADGGTPRVLTANLDRWVDHPAWAPDGQSLYAIIEDDRTQYLAKIPLQGGAPTPVMQGRDALTAYSVSPQGEVAVLWESTEVPAEVFAVDGSTRRALSRVNDSLMATLVIGKTQEISAKSKDGTIINGFMVLPPDYQAGKRYPTILRVHGGPVGQFPLDFNYLFQYFAANGYVVIAMNPRGSSGRGEKFATAIYADWGNKDVQDVLAGVDLAVARGIADPAKLGVGGWSYGGILTNYLIASDTRFKAAVSGASISNIFAGFGTDMYIREYSYELGTPWKNTDLYLKLSYPFLHADRIVTPTLFLCGQKDFNVPLINSEQMYEALRSLGRETELIIYPDQYHGISKPSYVRDRIERYLGWYDRFLK